MMGDFQAAVEVDSELAWAVMEKRSRGNGRNADLRRDFCEGQTSLHYSIAYDRLP